MDTENDFKDNCILRIFINILGDSLDLIFKSNSLSINMINMIFLRHSLLNKTVHLVKTEIFSIKL